MARTARAAHVVSVHHAAARNPKPQSRRATHSTLRKSRHTREKKSSRLRIFDAFC
jgi:hypothetical protein